MSKKTTLQEFDEMLILLKEGHSISEVSRILKRNFSTIWRRLKKYLPPEEYEKLKESSRGQRFLNSKPEIKFRFGLDDMEKRLNQIEMSLYRIEIILKDKVIL